MTSSPSGVSLNGNNVFYSTKNDIQCRGLRKVVEARRKVRLPKVPYREEKDCYLHNEGRFFYPSDKDCKVNLKAPALANKINHEGSVEGGDPQERVSSSRWHGARIFLRGVLKGRRGGGEEEGVVVQVDGADDDVVLLVGADVVGEKYQDHEALKDRIAAKMALGEGSMSKSSVP